MIPKRRAGDGWITGPRAQPGLLRAAAFHGSARLPSPPRCSWRRRRWPPGWWISTSLPGYEIRKPQRAPARSRSMTGLDRARRATRRRSGIPRVPLSVTRERISTPSSVIIESQLAEQQSPEPQADQPRPSAEPAIPIPRSRPAEASLALRIDPPLPPPARSDDRTMFQKLADLVPMRFTLASLDAGRRSVRQQAGSRRARI